MTATVTPSHRPEPSVELRRDPLAPEAELALAYAKQVLEGFRGRGRKASSVEIRIYETPSRLLAFASAIGGSK